MAIKGASDMEPQDTFSVPPPPLSRKIDRRSALGMMAAGVGALATSRVVSAQDATDEPAPVLGNTASPSPRLLTPENSVLALIDHQPQIALTVRSLDLQLLINNAAGIAEAARAYSVPTILSTVMAEAARNPIFPEIQATFPDVQPIDRFNTNAWESQEFVEAIAATGRSKLIMAGLLTEICLVQVALSALDAGYEVYVLVDVSGGMSLETHNTAVQRLTMAGAVPVTWMAILSEWQRDYTRTQTLPAMFAIGKAYGGAIALGANLFEAQTGGQ